MNTKDLRIEINKTCEKFKNKTFIDYYLEDGSERLWTYQDVYEEILEIETIYRKLNCREHDRIAIIMPHSPFAILAGLGISYAGATLVYIDATLPIEEIQKLLINSDVAAVFSASNILKNMDEDIRNQYPCYCLNTNGKFEYVTESKSNAKVCDIYDAENDVMAILYSSNHCEYERDMHYISKYFQIYTVVSKSEWSKRRYKIFVYSSV